MSIIRYIKGIRRGKEAHRIELEAMKDSFLSDALEGYDAIEDNHTEHIIRLQRQIKKQTENNKGIIIPQQETFGQKPLKIKKSLKHRKKLDIPWQKWSVAATILFCLSLGGYHLWKNYELPSPSQPLILSESQKKNENIEIKADTIISKQDSLIIYMPASPLPKTDLIASAQILDDKLNESGRDVEMLKLESPQIPLPSAAEFSDVLVDATDISKPMEIAMNEKSQSLDEVVVTGYGTVQRKMFTGSVAQIDTPVLDKSLDSRMAGVDVSVKPAKPEPEVGMKAYKNYLKTSVIHPTDSICAGIKGKVKLQFYVNQKGSPYNIHVIKSLCKTADAEAIRLIQSGGKWKYGSEVVEMEVSF